MVRSCNAIVLSLAALALASLALTSAAWAVDKMTNWFTIEVKPADPSLPPLYLTNTSEGVRLERYRSGDATQQWTYVHLGYPAAPAVTGGWVLSDMVQCTFSGCPFTGNGEGLRKYVNRASGGCLAFRKSKAATVPCSSKAEEIERQNWLWSFADADIGPDGPPRSYSFLIGSSGDESLCLQASFKNKPIGDTSGLQPAECAPGAWYQSFRFLLAATVACRADFDWQLCFAQ